MNDQAKSAPDQKPSGSNGKNQPGQPASNRPPGAFVESGAPKGLRGNIYLTLHTRTAMRVLRGRRGNRKRGVAPIIGLYHFGSRMRDIYRAASEDDPYADRSLVQTEQRFEAATQKLAQLTNQLLERLDSVRSSQMEVEECLSLQPRRFRIKTPRYGAQGARLIGDLDRVVRLAYTANHVNQLTRDEMKNYIDAAGHEVRATFALQEKHVYLGITRADLRQLNQRWQSAQDHMGELEPEYLEATTKPKYGPASRAIPGLSTALFQEESDPEAHGKVEVEEVPLEDGKEEAPAEAAAPPIDQEPAGEAQEASAG